MQLYLAFARYPVPGMASNLEHRAPVLAFLIATIDMNP